MLIWSASVYGHLPIFGSAEAVQEEAGQILGGEGVVVEIDETMVGGRLAGTGVLAGRANKVYVVGGRVHMQTVKNTKRNTLQPIIEAKIDQHTEKVVTDGAAVYQQIFRPEKHEAGNHAEDKRKRRKMNNQTIEGAFSLFKRGLVGSYHKLSGDHLDRYLGEFCWRFNRRTVQLWMFQMALENLGKNKPLTYKELLAFTLQNELLEFLAQQEWFGDGRNCVRKTLKHPSIIRGSI